MWMSSLQKCTYKKQKGRGINMSKESEQYCLTIITITIIVCITILVALGKITIAV